ncbi:CBS domain-containing protein [Variovorax sp. YR216]|uniref:CBS domain-containing protein n=1 Tax=Variovorax sp. YR216 TaxID=1882828 RepID=UPI0008955690|nr:CBS domain-containing protein [Variovorax sp. YR216]SEB24387.1 CBS domain-containing protein [Variovorax sp. YR216]
MYQRLTAGEICTRIVTIAFRGTRLAEAARLMREQEVGCLLVVEEADPGRVVVGVLTDRDIVTSVVAKDLDARVMTVAEAMTADPAVAREQDSALDVLETMRRKGVRRMPVTTPEGVLVGIVTLDDLFEVLAEEMQALAGVVASGRRRVHTATA